jgi:hypothetical protein
MNVLELIERYNGAWNAQDIEAIDALHHADVVFHNHTADERANNPTLRFATRSLRSRSGTG